MITCNLPVDFGCYTSLPFPHFGNDKCKAISGTFNKWFLLACQQVDFHLH